MSVWDGLVGQEAAVAGLRRLAETNAALTDASASAVPGGPDTANIHLAHSWLFTGPAGSGRSNLALAFAAALLCPTGGCGSCPSCTMARAGTHPDLRVFRTDKVVIVIDDVRDLVAASYMSPSTSKLRVQVIEDADRMSERTSNVLLKAIEEPPASTIWILCSPSEADMLPTIRSRVRTVRLRTPTVEQVADFIVNADGVEPELALRCAREAQCHIGMARRLATDAAARQRRDASIGILLGVVSPSHVAKGASDLVKIAEEDSQAADAARLDRDRAEFLRQLGIPVGDPVPPQYRAQVRAFDEDMKRRSTRSLRDGVDRILLDFESVARDALLLRLGIARELINVERQAAITAWASRRRPEQLITNVDEIAVARMRIAANVSPLLALEAMLATVIDREVLT